MNMALYEKEKKKLLIELSKLQKWIIAENKKIAVVFEGEIQQVKQEVFLHYLNI